MKKLLIFLLLITPYCFADVCNVYSIPEIDTNAIYKCKNGDVLDLTVRGTDITSNIWFNSLKSGNCNHKYTISINLNPSVDTLSLSCVFKKNRD